LLLLPPVLLLLLLLLLLVQLACAITAAAWLCSIARMLMPAVPSGMYPVPCCQGWAAGGCPV
jgi:hypothetical protein